MLDRLSVHHQQIAASGGRPIRDVEEDYNKLRAATDIDDLLQLARIEYIAPADATSTQLPNESVDVVFSNSVLEHVVPDIIGRLFSEAYRVLRPGGLMIHSLNCGDHYAYFDKRISFINYLTYTSDEWRRWDNKLLYQNRLRPSDFVKQSERAGFEIVLRKQKPRPGLLELLPTLAIAPEFRDYSPEELCTTSIDFVSRKPATAHMTNMNTH
jgi:SAM-dependent methyltransferase